MKTRESKDSSIYEAKYLEIHNARLCIDCDTLVYLDCCSGDTSAGPWHCDDCT